jgi:hypothetical protein
MVAQRPQRTAPAQSPRSGAEVSPFDAVSYIFLTMAELEPLALEAGDAELVEAVRQARAAAAAALARMGQAGGR